MPEVSTRDPQFRRSIPMDPVLRDRLRRIAWAEQRRLAGAGVGHARGCRQGLDQEERGAAAHPAGSQEVKAKRPLLLGGLRALLEDLKGSR